MPLLVERIPTLRDNYTYLLVCQQTGEAAVVDAPEAEPVFRRVEKLGARVTKVLSTHHHPDHSQANPELAKRYDAPVYGHVSDARRIPGFTNGLEEGDTLTVGNATARVLFIPAHTRGHIAYVFDDAVFCGDTLFAAGCGRLFEGTPAQMHDSLAKFMRLPDATRAYCAHEYTLANLRFAKAAEPGNQAVVDWEARARALREVDVPTVPTTIVLERATNPCLRCNESAVIASTSQRAGKPLADAVSVLAVLREWKNNF